MPPGAARKSDPLLPVSFILILANSLVSGVRALRLSRGRKCGEPPTGPGHAAERNAAVGNRSVLASTTDRPRFLAGGRQQPNDPLNRAGWHGRRAVKCTHASVTYRRAGIRRPLLAPPYLVSSARDWGVAAALVLGAWRLCLQVSRRGF